MDLDTVFSPSSQANFDVKAQSIKSEEQVIITDHCAGIDCQMYTTK